jgi:hypothetical protein
MPIDSLIKLELRPCAEADLHGFPPPVKATALKALRLMSSMTLLQLQANGGLDFHKLQGMSDPLNGRGLWAFRINRGARGICLLETGPKVVIVSMHSDHKKACTIR